MSKTDWQKRGRLLFGRLKKLIVLNDSTEELLQILCKMWASYNESCDEYEAQGKTVVTATGQVKPHPAVNNAIKFYEAYLKLCVTLKLTPQNDGTDPTQDDADLDDLIDGA